MGLEFAGLQKYATISGEGETQSTSRLSLTLSHLQGGTFI